MNNHSTIPEKFNNLMSPLANWISNNRYIKALSDGFVNSMPITLGVALIAILINLPIQSWTDFLTNIGLYSIGLSVISLTLSLLGIYVVITISYNFTKNENANIIVGVLLATSGFILLMPLDSVVINGESIEFLKTSYMGSSGIFPAMLCGLLIPSAYVWLSKKNIRLHFPDTVPPMVSQSLSPTFIAMILYICLFLIKYLCSLTPYGNFFSLIQELIATPVSFLGANPIAFITLSVFMNFCWFFGIHPAPLEGVYMPIIMTTITSAIEAFTQGNPIPNEAFLILIYISWLRGGQGNTLGLVIASLFAKSDKYKALRKLVSVPCIFNINEPIIFGFPIMMNPIYIVPMVTTALITQPVIYGLIRLFPVTINPTISLPWVTPAFITMFLQGGAWMLLIWLIAIVLDFLIWLPFFKFDDKKALSEETTVLTKA